MVQFFKKITLSRTGKEELYSCGFLSILMIAILGFSVASLFGIEFYGLPTIKVLALFSFILAAIVAARMNRVPIFFYAAGGGVAVFLVVSGLLIQSHSIESLELWRIKPLVFVSVIAIAVPLLIFFDYSEARFQKGLAIIIVLLMITLFAQAVIFLASKVMFDFQAALGLAQTRSHHRIYSIDVFRLSGIAIEPAIYCTTMFSLLILSGARMNWAIRIPAEVSIGICLSAMGWIMLGVLFYRNFLLMPRREWLKSFVFCMLALISSLLLIYPTDASKFTLLRIVCPQTDPSANVRVLAFLPKNTPQMDLEICPPKGEVPNQNDIMREAANSHQRGSNLTFVLSAFGVPGLIIFSACLLSLTVLTRKFYSAPIFAFAFLMSSFTEPIFWLGFLGCALLLKQGGAEPGRVSAKEVLV